jgi:hypothetical protein
MWLPCPEANPTGGSYVGERTDPAHKLLVIVLHHGTEVHVAFKPLVYVLGRSTIIGKGPSCQSPRTLDVSLWFGIELDATSRTASASANEYKSIEYHAEIRSYALTTI